MVAPGCQFMTTVVETVVIVEPAALSHRQYMVPTHGRETRAAGSVAEAGPRRLGNGMPGLACGVMDADVGDGLLVGELLICGVSETLGVPVWETLAGLPLPVQLVAAKNIGTKTEANLADLLAEHLPFSLGPRISRRLSRSCWEEGRPETPTPSPSQKPLARRAARVIGPPLSANSAPHSEERRFGLGCGSNSPPG